MKKTILALSMVFATVGITAQAQTRAVTQVTSEVICHECTCGREHYIETQRIVDRNVPTPCLKTSRDTSGETAAMVAGAILGVAVATVGIACVLSVAVEATVIFGFVWFVSSIFCVR